MFLPSPLEYVIAGMPHHPSVCPLLFGLPKQPLPAPALLSLRLLSLWLSGDLSDTYLQQCGLVCGHKQTDKIQLCLPMTHTLPTLSWPVLPTVIHAQRCHLTVLCSLITESLF